MASTNSFIPQTSTYFSVSSWTTILDNLFPHLHFLVAHGTWKYHNKHFSQCLSHFGAFAIGSFFCFAISSRLPSHVLSLQNWREDGTLNVRKQLSHFFFEIGVFLFLILSAQTSRVIIVGCVETLFPDLVVGVWSNPLVFVSQYVYNFMIKICRSHHACWKLKKNVKFLFIEYSTVFIYAL